MTESFLDRVAAKKFLEPVGEGRYIVEGAVYLMSVDRGGLGFHLKCWRCDATWNSAVPWETLRAIYVVIPAQPSAKTLVERTDFLRKFVERAAGHVCMPRGYTPIPTSLLRRVNKDAPRSEQLESIATVVAELAIDAQRGVF